MRNTPLPPSGILIHSYFVVDSGWVLLFPGALWMVAITSWCTLNISWCIKDVDCYFVLHFGWLLLFFGALWMVGAIFFC